MSDTPDTTIVDAPLAKTLGEKYLAYALSTIMHRALPDVRDGLKPVHRRLLYAMRQLKLDPGSGFKKSARVVGDVIGKYHPHGDQAVYDALVRLAQDFSVRFPLIDGQGNFGNVDGDGAAAMRYTEARLTEVAGALLEGIDEDTVDFRPTYDGEEQEPVVLPGGFPNLLANGSSGIAVGMATNIPPHNVGELCDAALHLIKTPNAQDDTLVKYIPGPDFPTGGVVVDDPSAITAAYRTGRGAFTVRAKWEKEDLGRGQWQIVVTEIPYQVQKSKLVERLAELITSKKAPFLADVRDESAEDVRLVLEPKSRGLDPDAMMEQLFRMSDLETRFALNMNVLDARGVPRVMSLKEVLQAFLDHRKEVLVRRSRFRMEKIERRLEVLDGYLIAYLNLDEVIRIIRYEDKPKTVLMETFSLSDVQAEAILNMRLRSLRKLEEMEIKTEHKALKKELKELKALIASDELQWKSVEGEVKDIKARFGQKTPLGKRRSAFGTAPVLDDAPMEQLVEKERVTVVLSEKGWIRALKGHLESAEDLKFKEGDRLKLLVHAQTTDKLIAFATNGKFYTLAGDRLPGGRGHGEPVRLMVDLGNDEDIVSIFVHDPERKLLVASSAGHGFIVPEAEVLATKRSGKQVLTVKAPAEAQLCRPVPPGTDHLAVIGENRKLLVFPLDQVPEMVRGKGVTLQKYRDGGLGDAKAFVLKDGLSVSTPSGRTSVYTKKDLAEWLGQRAQAGRLPPPKFPRNSGNRFDA